MVGNDVNEDMVAETLGMKVFLLTDCLLNKDNKDISAYPHGGFPGAFELCGRAALNRQTEVNKKFNIILLTNGIIVI